MWSTSALMCSPGGLIGRSITKQGKVEFEKLVRNHLVNYIRHLA
jgi:hypothetical protein